MNDVIPSIHHPLEVNVHKKGEVYYLHIPRWHLLVQGTDLNQTYEDLCRQIDDLTVRFREVGLELEKEPDPGTSTVSSQGQFMKQGLTSIVTILVASFIIGLFLFLGMEEIGQRLKITQDAIQHTFHQISSPALLGKKVIDGVISSANVIKMWTPERKAELRESLKIIVQEIQPFTDEIHPLFTSHSLELREKLPKLEKTRPGTKNPGTTSP